jgi:GNAT superfamily N-acetyltransferase
MAPIDTPSQPAVPGIRVATASDLPTVLRILALLDPPGTPAMKLRRAAQVFDRIRRYPDYTVWLVEAHNEPVGTYSLIVLDNLGHQGKPTAVIESMAVLEASRGLGIGRRMVAHAIAEARKRGCYKVALSSNIGRADAHAFYEHLGFRRHGYSFVVDG